MSIELYIEIHEGPQASIAVNALQNARNDGISVWFSFLSPFALHRERRIPTKLDRPDWSTW